MPSVLIADDSPPARSLMSKHFLEWGFDVETAADGREAFRLATTVEYDLIVMDLNMPDWDGEDAINSLRIVLAADESVRTGNVVKL